MIKRLLPVAILGAALLGNTGCSNNNGEYKKYQGIEYKIVKHVPGKTAAIGDMIQFNLMVKADTTVLANTWKEGRPVPPTRVDSPSFRGDLKTIFPLLSAGDSALVRISCDTIMKSVMEKTGGQSRLPPWMKKGKFITFTISVISVTSMEDYKKEMDAKKSAQIQADDKMLTDYFAKNNIKAQKTASGLYYTIQSPGSGEQISTGQVASVRYTGKTIDGKIFDSNVDTSISHHGELLTFPVGMHRMIPGMDEGIALLKKGSKATLYLPSSLGYGEQGQPNIPPNSILIFDVEVTDVKPAGANPQMPPQQQ